MPATLTIFEAYTSHGPIVLEIESKQREDGLWQVHGMILNNFDRRAVRMYELLGGSRGPAVHVKGEGLEALLALADKDGYEVWSHGDYKWPLEQL